MIRKRVPVPSKKVHANSFSGGKFPPRLAELLEKDPGRINPKHLSPYQRKALERK